MALKERVDFFFVLSGFFLMQHFARLDKNIDGGGYIEPAIIAAKYTWGRYMRLIPYYLVAFFVFFIVYCCTHNIKIIKNIPKISVWELLMLGTFGIVHGGEFFVGPGWYCSSLIINSMLVYFLLAKFRKTYIYLIAPFSFMIIFSYISQKFGFLNRWTHYDTFVATGTLRGFAEMGLVCISFEVSEKFKEKIDGVVICTVIELVCFSYVLYNIFHLKKSRADFTSVLLMAVLIVFFICKKGLVSKLFDNHMSGYLGKISICIYLTHLALQRYINWSALFSISKKIAIIPYLVAVVLFAIVTNTFVERCLEYIKGKSVDEV